MDPKAEIEAALRAALRKIAPEHADAPLLIERPRQAEHGDFSTNIALQAYLAALTARLFETAERSVRWHLDVDPLEFD